MCTRVRGLCQRLAGPGAWGLRVDSASLIRGALLHDYFLYDWHRAEEAGKWHGFRHAQRALDNAQRDFHLNAVERDVIRKHMFPLNLRPPRYRESVLVSCADKLCALGEMVELSALRRRVRRVEACVQLG